MAYDEVGSVKPRTWPTTRWGRAYDKAGQAKDMAYEKMGSTSEKAGQAKDFAYDKAGNATYDKAEDVIRMATHKGDEATGMGYGTYERAKEGSRNAKDMASDKAHDVRETAWQTMDYVKDKATDTYGLGSEAAGKFEDAVYKVGERYGAAKD